MKKSFLLAVLAAVLSMSTNAQVVIRNDFGTPVGNADDLNSDVNWSWNDDYHRTGNRGNIYEDDYDYDDPYFFGGLSWYNNKTYNVFGLNGGYLSWNKFGLDASWSADVEIKAFMDINISGNYSLGLWKTGSSMGMLTFALGPSYRTVKEGNDTKGYFDVVADPRLIIRSNCVQAILGCQLRMKDMHFTKLYTDNPVFHFGLAYCF